MMDIVRFESSGFLYLLLLILPIIVYYIYKCRDGHAALNTSSIEGVRGVPRTLKHYLRHIPFVFRLFAYALLVVALARPQSVSESSTTTSEGIDIVMALDVSSSMLAQDFKPDRIGASKEVAKQFILDRKSDRMGLVVFAGESFTQVPLTTDKAALINMLMDVKMGVIDDGTAIGNGLATAVSRLKDSKSKSKVVILLTDGVNNRGQIAPQMAAEIATTYGIKVYTIGVGTRGMAPSPRLDAWGNTVMVSSPVEIDEELLEEMAELTGGRYFRATDNQKLADIYNEINQLETSEVEIENFTDYHDLYYLFLLIGSILIVAELLFKYLFLRQIP